MTSSDHTSQGRFGRIDVAELKRLLAGDSPPLLLDVRRAEAFGEKAETIPTAVPLELDREPVLLPDLPRDRPIVAYCL